IDERAFEPPLADEAPRADHVGDDVDTHGTRLRFVRCSAQRRASGILTGRGRAWWIGSEKAGSTRRMAKRGTSIYDHDLDRGAANFAPLSPLTFLERAASIWPRKVAIIHGNQRYTYAQFHLRCRRLASALTRRGIGRGDTVAIMAPNVPALLEAH